MENKETQQWAERNKQLKELVKLESFRTWRDVYILPELEEIDKAKSQVLSLSEADIKALILYESKIKYLFNRLFDNT